MYSELRMQLPWKSKRFGPKFLQKVMRYILLRHPFSLVVSFMPIYASKKTYYGLSFPHGVLFEPFWIWIHRSTWPGHSAVLASSQRIFPSSCLVINSIVFILSGLRVLCLLSPSCFPPTNTIFISGNVAFFYRCHYKYKTSQIVFYRHFTVQKRVFLLCVVAYLHICKWRNHYVPVMSAYPSVRIFLLFIIEPIRTKVKEVVTSVRESHILTLFRITHPYWLYGLSAKGFISYLRFPVFLPANSFLVRKKCMMHTTFWYAPPFIQTSILGLLSKDGSICLFWILQSATVSPKARGERGSLRCGITLEADELRNSYFLCGFKLWYCFHW